MVLITFDQIYIFPDKISEYFGIKIAFYFSWLGHYTSALTVPALVGLLFWVRLEFLLQVHYDFPYRFSSRVKESSWMTSGLSSSPSST